MSNDEYLHQANDTSGVRCDQRPLAARHYTQSYDYAVGHEVGYREGQANGYHAGRKELRAKAAALAIMQLCLGFVAGILAATLLRNGAI